MLSYLAVALGGAAKDFGSRGRKGAGHDERKSERPASAGNPAVGRVGTEKTKLKGKPETG